MKRPLLASILALAAATGVGFIGSNSAARAFPEPSVVPVSWELNLKHGPIERLIMTIDGKQQTFWFMRYSVINNTGKDVLFTPSVELMTDTGQVQEAFKDVPSDVFKKIKEMYKNPLLESPTNVVGKLLQGEDNAKDGVLIFANLDTDARNFQIFFSGLSGETAEVKNPITGKPVILQKSLVLEYGVPGQAIGIDPVPVYKGSHWVMKESESEPDTAAAKKTAASAPAEKP
jgi:hypothetical protein